MALARKDSKKALMFITDGNSNIGGKPASAARKLKRKGVEIYVIGVGKKVKVEELRSIASSPYGVHVFRIEQYSDIEDLKDSITGQECLFSTFFLLHYIFHPLFISILPSFLSLPPPIL